MLLAIFLFLITNGSIRLFGYYFRWNSLFVCIFVHKINNHFITDWVWFGSAENYSKFLTEENIRLRKIVAEEKEKANG